MGDLLEFWRGASSRTPRPSSSTEVEEVEGELILELEVAEGDLGRVIGRGGRVANALRGVMKAAPLAPTSASWSRYSTSVPSPCGSTSSPFSRGLRLVLGPAPVTTRSRPAASSAAID